MRGRRVDPFDKRSMGFSMGLHLTLILAAWAATLYEPEEMVFLTYEIELVSPPPAVAEEEVEETAEELVIETPEPEPLPPDPEPEEVVPVEEAEPEPEPEPIREEPAEEPEPEPAEETTLATTEEAPPEEPPEVTGQGIEVRIEGLRRDYPEYYNNIIFQINRCFRWRDGGRWQTTILFWINQDGTVSDAGFESRSGNTSFDFEALGAIDCAGDRSRFGPLPEDLPYDRLPIIFEFRPSGEAIFIPEYGERAGVQR